MNTDPTNRISQSHPESGGLSPDRAATRANPRARRRPGSVVARAVVMALLAAVVVWLAAVLPRASAAPDTPAAGGTIAYVNAATGDEIRLVEADGSNNRPLWAHGQPDPLEVYNVWTLDWKPDGDELAFASNHENYCSLNDGDIFAIGRDGGDYRRLTQGPSCAGLAAYPKGTVNIPVRNTSIFGDSFSGFIYLQGAPSLLPVNLPPGGTTTVTFEDVADFGDGELQFATIIVGLNRAVSVASAVDVKAGATVTTAEMGVYIPDTFWESRSPTWRSDGSAVGFLLNFNSMLMLPPHPEPLMIGFELQTDANAMPDFADLLTWGPPSKANQLLYRGSVLFDSQGIYLTTENSATAGQKLLSYEVYEYVRGIAWLPDGSGFVFAVDELDGEFEAQRANIFEYTFATGQPRRVTDFEDLFVSGVTVSPDGQQIAFDLTAQNEVGADANIYVINRDGTGMRLLAENGRAPDWGPDGPVVIVPDEFIYLPSQMRP